MKPLIGISVTTAILAYIIITAIFAFGEKLHFLNPINNYKRFTKLNYFGVGLVTLLFIIIFLPYAIPYWICVLIWKLLTIGRK